MNGCENGCGLLRDGAHQSGSGSGFDCDDASWETASGDVHLVAKRRRYGPAGPPLPLHTGCRRVTPVVAHTPLWAGRREASARHQLGQWCTPLVSRPQKTRVPLAAHPRKAAEEAEPLPPPLSFRTSSPAIRTAAAGVRTRMTGTLHHRRRSRRSHCALLLRSHPRRKIASAAGPAHQTLRRHPHVAQGPPVRVGFADWPCAARPSTRDTSSAWHR